MITRKIFSFLNISLNVFLVMTLAACNLFGKNSALTSGWFGIGGDPSLALDDDEVNSLNWKNYGTVLGSVLSPTVTGDCKGGITEIRVKVGSDLKATATCTANRFSVALTGANAFTSNGLYSLSFIGVTKSGKEVFLSRSYDLCRVDPDTLLSFDSFPMSTIYSSENLSGLCNDDIDLTIAGTTTTCASASHFVEVLPLVMGSNSILVSWSDEHHNRGSRNFVITRNVAGSANVTVGMKSAAPQGALSLVNITSGAAILAPQIERVSVTGSQNGVVNQAIPLSRAPGAGATGLKLSVGNHSYVFCKNQDVSGGCIP